MLICQIPSKLAHIKDYEIGDIQVNGANYSDAEAIILLSGLKVGNRIKIPGGKINQAIKKLMGQRLFEDVRIIKTKTIDDTIFLEIQVQERPRLGSFHVSGIKKSEQADIKGLLENSVPKGTILTENNLNNIKQSIKGYYIEKGFLDASTQIIAQRLSSNKNTVKLELEVIKGDKVKIDNITFTGNENVRPRKLRSLMNNTHRKAKIFSASKLVDEVFAADKKAVLQFYRSKGFRDARIVKDSIWRTDSRDLHIHLEIDEGQAYYFGKITWKGNSIYTDEYLTKVLGIKKGELFDESLLDSRLNFALNGRDIRSLYMDNGHLFFQIEPVEVALNGQMIDLEIRIYEGAQAIVDKVTIKGNGITNEEVIRRSIRTLPGKKFSRSDIIRSQREIVNLGFFSPAPEELKVTPKINPEQGTVDIEYEVTEKPSDQIELSAGWQPRTNGAKGSLVGTLGLQMTNFSVGHLLKHGFSKGLPKGDGQTLSLRGQTNGSNYNSVNFSFTEPWLGKKKANTFTVAGFYNRLGYGLRSTESYQQLDILGGAIRFGTQLKVPDDFFVYSASVNFQRIRLENWTQNGFNLEDGSALENGTFYNLNLEQTIARNTIDNPFFPTRGSRISLTSKITPPWSVFRSNKNPTDATPQEKFKWLEYHKWRFDADWYLPLTKKLIFRASAKMGSIGSFNKGIGLSPFERFRFGDTGMNRQGGYTGIDLISMRGYNDTSDFSVNDNGGATMFNKFSLELRYPISLNPNATVYVLGFADAGNAWNNFRDYNPFDMKRTVGGGVRFKLPMIGLIGFDYGWGLDNPAKFGKLSVIFGFEPD